MESIQEMAPVFVVLVLYNIVSEMGSRRNVKEPFSMELATSVTTETDLIWLHLLEEAEIRGKISRVKIRSCRLYGNG